MDDSRSAGLRVSNISKRFGDITAVDDLSLTVERGSMIGFLGPNGAGKSTTMRAIVGMVEPDAGSLTWDGQPITDDVRNRFGYMPQERGLYARMKVREQVIYFGRLAGLTPADAAERTDHWLDRLGLADRHDSLVQDLSGGNQQRVQLAVSLVHDPELLVLDEPFAGLDPVAAETMRSIIAERASAGCGVLFSSHQLDLVESLCEHAVIIADGHVVAVGLVSDLRSASRHRYLTVRWTDPLDSWRPLDGTLRSFDGRRAVVDLPVEADPGANVAHAVAAGPVSEVAIAPPGLEEVFTDLVHGSTT